MALTVQLPGVCSFPPLYLTEDDGDDDADSDYESGLEKSDKTVPGEKMPVLLIDDRGKDVDLASSAGGVGSDLDELEEISDTDIMWQTLLERSGALAEDKGEEEEEELSSEDSEAESCILVA